MKKISAIFVLVLTLFASQFSMNVIHAEEGDDLSFTKTAEAVPGTVNTWDITLEVKNKPKIESASADIVLVLDYSGSMRGTRLTSMQKAAKEFVETILGSSGSTDSRIAIVSFAGYASIQANFTNNRDTLNQTIDSAVANGGTFLQAGVRQGREVLAGSTNPNKYMVVMSDGDANITNTITYNNSRSAYVVADINQPNRTV